METLKTKSQMLNRIAELAEENKKLKSEINRFEIMLDLAIKDNGKVLNNSAVIKEKLSIYFNTKDRHKKNIIRKQLKIISDFDWIKWVRFLTDRKLVTLEDLRVYVPIGE